MADPISPTPRQRPRYGWVRCESCSGTGKSRHFRGNSATINHLARGGSPTELPCSLCSGDGRIWAPLPADS